MESLSLGLSPHGRLVLADEPDAPPLDAALAGHLRQVFERGSGHGLLLLGADEAGTALPPVLSYWREFGARYVTALCTRTAARISARRAGAAPSRTTNWSRIAFVAPPMTARSI